MFEQEYTRANDRIHPRKDLLKELEAQWAKEADAPQEEEKGKVVAFPGWVRYAAMAAGILLCVGVGMGSVMLLSKGRSRTKSADAAAPVAMESAVVTEESKILTMPAAAAAPEPEAMADGAIPNLTMAAPTAADIRGTRPAASAAEVEAAIRIADDPAVRYGEDGGVADGEAGDEPETPVQPGAGPTQAPAAAATAETAYAPGQILRRDDLVAVYQPTTERVYVVRYDNKKMTNVNSLSLRESGARVKQIFWLGDELLALRERGGQVELLRFDVADWTKPSHLRNLTQSGVFLGAAEMGGRLCILSAYTATAEQPLPLVNGAAVNYGDVLLDPERPGSVFAVLTVYDPAQDGFAAQAALLADCAGAAFGHEKLLLWTAETALYVLSGDARGAALLAESALQGTVLDAGELGEGFSLLLEAGEDVQLIALDEDLAETGSAAAPGIGPVKWAQVYEDGAILLTEDTLHWLTASGDTTLALSGDGFCWLTVERGLVISADGRLQVVAVNDVELALVAAIQVKEDLSLLLEDPSALAYDDLTGRLVFPAGQRVYQYKLSGAADPKGTSLAFTDHKADDVRELRCFFLDDRLLIFTKNSAILCNENLAKQSTTKY